MKEFIMEKAKTKPGSKGLRKYNIINSFCKIIILLKKR